MADAVDMAAQIEGEHIAAGIARAAVPLPAGSPGTCEGCEWWMPRLVDGLCAFCRDGRARPIDWEPPVEPPLRQALPPPKRAPIVPHPANEESDMPAKTVCLPASAGSAIACLEAHAQSMGLTLGAAAADLIERGAGPAAIGSPVSLELAQLGIHALVAEICRRVDEQDRVPDLTDALADMTARAEAAEGRIAQMKALIA